MKMNLQLCQIPLGLSISSAPVMEGADALAISYCLLILLFYLQVALTRMTGPESQTYALEALHTGKAKI